MATAKVRKASAGAGGEEVKAIEFEAEVRQIKSMADGTYNLVLNLPENMLPQTKALMGWLLQIVKGVLVLE